MELHEIVFPVFKMRQYNKLETIDNIVYVHTHWQSYVLDNRNLQGDTIGVRRLKMRDSNIYPFKTIVKNPRDLVVSAKTNDTFVDNSGAIFKYQKTKRCDILCFEIKSVIFANSKAIVHFWEYPTPLVIPSNICDTSYKYACIVKYGAYYMLYSLEENYIKPFKKRL